MKELFKKGNRPKGKVYLVGAGPGNPELLTIKAANTIRAAEVVLHDALVSAEVLALVSPSAHVLNVGKRCGVKSITQDEINSMMVRFADDGNVVVRLKSGDPLIFGRAGEEISALREAGIEFEIVSGITSALAAAAAAQIPLTDRHTSERVVFVSAHQAVGKAKQDWRNLISSDCTIVVYMPGNHAELAKDLMQAGMNHETPCLVVSKISMPNEVAHQSTLQNLHEIKEIPSPSVLIIGNTVSSYCPSARTIFGALAAV